MTLLVSLFQSYLTASLVAAFVIVLLLFAGSMLAERYSLRWRYWAGLILAVWLVVPVRITLPEPPVTIPTVERDVVIRYEEPAKIPDTTVEQQPAATPDAPADVTPIIPSYPQQGTEEYLVSGVVPIPQKKEFSLSLTAAAAILWLGGAVVYLLWQGIGALLLHRRVLQYSHPVKEAAILQLFEEQKQALGIRRDISLCENRHIASPMMVGIFRPQILMPTVAVSRRDFELIVRHELTHYRRRDLWYKLLVMTAHALHWYNPLMILLERTASNDIEVTCDETVVAGTDSDYRQHYCEAILRVLRCGRSRQLTLSTAFNGNKAMLMQRFDAVLSGKRRGTVFLVLALIVTALCSMMVACGDPAVLPPITVLPGDSVIVNPLPEVTGPDEAGYFPLIPTEDYETWVVEGEPMQKPDDSTLLPFLQQPECIGYLRENYPDITDWQVLYEDRAYARWESMYDPYTYQWRESYIPVWRAVLATEQSEEFDRMMILARRQIFVISAEGGYLPRLEWEFYLRSGHEEDWQIGDYSNIKLLDNPHFAGASLSGIYSPALDRAVLSTEAEGECVTVNHFSALQNYTGGFSVSPLRWYYDDSVSQNRSILYLQNEEGDSHLDMALALYDPADDSVTMMAGAVGELPQITAMPNGKLAVSTQRQLMLYDLTAAEAHIPYATLGSNPKGLLTRFDGYPGDVAQPDGDWGFQVEYNIHKDRTNDNFFAFFYHNSAEDSWRIAVIDSQGNIRCDYNTELEASTSFLGSVDVSDGLVYFYHHPYNGGVPGNGYQTAEYCANPAQGYLQRLQ